MLALSQFLPFIEICNALGKLPLELEIERSFVENGGDSLCAATLASACKLYGSNLKREVILTSPSLRALLSAVPEFTTAQSYFTSAESGLTKTLAQLRSMLLDGASAPATPSTSSESVFTAQSETSFPPTPLSSLQTPPPQSETAPRSSKTARAVGTGEEESLTRGQLAFIHGTLQSPGTNIIAHRETYYTQHLPILKDAWRAVIESEPIFYQQTLRDYNQGVNLPVFSWHDSQDGEDEEGGSPPSTALGSSFTVTHQDTALNNPRTSQITWTVHHALVDGFAANLVLDKVLRRVNGQLALPGPSFSHFARDMAEYEKYRQADGQRYWSRKLEDMQEAQGQLLFPSTRAGGSGIASAVVAVDISAACQDMAAVASRLGTTRAVFFHAAWALTLSLYCDADVVAFGTVNSGRSLPIPGTLEVVGPLVRTLPFVVRLDDETQSVGDLVSTIHRHLLELDDFHWMPTPEDGNACSYESALSVQFDFPPNQGWDIYPLERETSQETVIPTAVTVEADRRALLRYHQQRLSEENARRMAATFNSALELLQREDEGLTVGAVLQELQRESSAECLERYSNCSAATKKGSITEDLVTLFERQARQNPLGAAVERGDESVSYAELDRQAGAVAARLAQHMAPGDVVCVHADRSVGWLVAIFGVLKAGGVYCPLDCGIPAKLRSTIFALSGARCFVAPHEDQLLIAPDTCLAAFSVDSAMRGCDAAWAHRPEPRPEAPAYVCFTSGSTGVPKGVLCSHQGLVAFQSTLEVRLFAQPGKRVGQVMSVAFDGSIHELFSALTHGATLVLSSGPDPFAHLRSVDAAILTPSLASVLNPTDFERLKWVYLVGEPVPQPLCDLWAVHKQLYNMYGPTEGTCGATIKRLLPKQPVTIGVPNPTTRLYILDSRGRPTPPGMVGEIFLAGVQIAKGYLNLPQQTSERFLPDLIWAPEENMYRTGDRGYWDEDGEVVCIGRIDREIKPRGFRLDLNDLEIRISRACPSLQGVAVAVNGDGLILMVQPATVDIDEHRSLLTEALPHYAMPRRIIPVDRLPLTPAGKVDYKAIAMGGATSAALRPATCESFHEAAVAEAFRSVLSLGYEVKLTPESEFIELGGHSLRQMQLQQVLSRRFNLRLPLSDIIKRPTVRSLASLIEELEGVAEAPQPTSTDLPRTESASPLESEWVQKYNTSSGSSSFNVCVSSTLDGALVDREKLASAWNTVMSRHRLLSCRYVADDASGEVQRLYVASPPRVQRVRSVDLWLEANRPFDVSAAGLIRVFITEDRLVLVLSHIIADYTAVAILLREASTLYRGEELSTNAPCYAQTLAWSGVPCPTALDFWSRSLRGCPEKPPLLGRITQRQSYGGTSALSLMSPRLLDDVMQCARARNVTLQQMALACMAAVLDAERPSETDVLLGAPYINRATPEDLETFGLFLEPLPIRVRYRDDDDDESSAEALGGTHEGFLHSVRASAQDALAHAVSWHQLLAHLDLGRHYPDHPLFDVMVTVHELGSAQAPSLAMQASGIEPSFVWSQGAKFKLLCEFTVLPGQGLVLRLEYDSQCVGAADVSYLQGAIPIVMGLLAQGVPHQELKRAVLNERRETGAANWVPIEGNLLFGQAVTAISF